MKHFAQFSVLILCGMTCGLMPLTGCGGGAAGTTPASTQAVAITTQPASQSIPLDSTGTFSVMATGTGPLTYQWRMNDEPISGANSATYTTPTISLSDSGELYTVAVSNSDGTVISNPATLTVGPRSPKPGDLRFQQVDALSMQDEGVSSSAFFLNGIGYWDNNATGGPLRLASDTCVIIVPNDCGWEVSTTPLPSGQSGLKITYTSVGVYASLASDLAGQGAESSMAASNSVVTSLDLQPASNAYGAAWMQTTQNISNFDLRREVVASSAVLATVAQDAAESRVVTAVSFDDSTGLVDLLSYGWQGDTTTLYDTQVVNAASMNVATAAATLAAQGYILTAFGGNLTDGFLLIGTKVQGDTLPRLVITNSNFQNPTQLEGYAPVAWWLASSQQGYGNFVYEH
ncbi:MAG: immunoglobulin domain-containing family protein [Acidobacteriaceae bacterium]